MGMYIFIGIMVIILIISIFFICRELFCWYWKINEMRDLLQSINKKLDRIGDNSSLGYTKSSSVKEKQSDTSKQSDNLQNDETNNEIVNDELNIDTIHFNKILDRTMDRNLVKQLNDLYTKENDYYCFNDNVDYGSETKEYVKKYVNTTLDDIIKFENR